MINASQIRAARGLLDWTRDQLAAASGVSVPALSKIETAKSNPHSDTLAKVQNALEQAGILFTDNSGVKLKSDIVAFLEGAEGFKRFSDDRYFTALNDNREFLMCGGFQESFIKATGIDYYNFHAERMRDIDGFKMRALNIDSSGSTTQLPSYIKIRHMPPAYSLTVPFYVYGSKLAIVLVDEQTRIIVIDDERTANSYRKQFDLLWKISRETKDD